MQKALITALFSTLTLGSHAVSFSDDKPVKVTAALSTDEVAIYRAVLQKYVSKESANLNISLNTYPLKPDSLMSGLSAPDCLKGIQLENLSMVSHSFHVLPADILPGPGMKLVDPKKQAKIVKSNDPSKTIGKNKSVGTAVEDAFASGLFSMSEIAFDKDHRFGVVSYSFWCGSLCGNGSTLVFEKVDGVWKNANRPCGGWVS